jgi:hypothetical protein
MADAVWVYYHKALGLLVIAESLEGHAIALGEQLTLFINSCAYV